MNKFLLFLFFLFQSYTSLTQGHSGVVLDLNEHPIIGVHIINKSNETHTHSRENGKFHISNVSIGDSLLFSHVGHKAKYVIVKNLTSELKVVMETSTISIEEIVITQDLNNIQLMAEIDLQINPVISSQEILQQVPGLFIGQHAGGGKAEQIFLRGFDIDHGTDISIAVDGMPVNMVSHAHGQGYADLHFLIPETVSKVDFGKGPYYADVGNFNTAGYVQFTTKQILDNNTLKFELGEFNTKRFYAGLNLLNSNSKKSFVAAELLSSDGPFESPQNFNRLNLLGKYSINQSSFDKIDLLVSHFTSKWDASGQIPQRAVDQGLITRFGAIDDTEGGNTSRTNLSLSMDKFLNNTSLLKNQIFLNRYDFNLFSNFTFFLEDSLFGDQINQIESRTIVGWNSAYNKSINKNSWQGNLKLGANIRYDKSDGNALSNTINRRELQSRVAYGDIQEYNGAFFGELSVSVNQWTFNGGLRFDYFDFKYNDKLANQYSTQSKDGYIISPKLNLSYNPSKQMQLYLKTGRGFHSNDTRAVIQNQVSSTLPTALGADLGIIWKPIPKMFINTALWHLYLEQEFVYVGDAGIVEPSGQTRRQGVDLSIRYQIADWLYWNFDGNKTLARSIDAEDGSDYIPLAPEFTIASGLNIVHTNGIKGGVRYRFMDDRAANEDNSIVAPGYHVVDASLSYSLSSWTLGIRAQNLFNVAWNETQFATESRLRNETESVEEIHFTPGVPFNIMANLEYRF
jgi:outer membrane receptor protein involved in Fe transport